MTKYSFLKSLDFLGNTVNFKVQSEDTYKTKVGGLLTILIFLSWIFLFIFFGQNFFNKTNPTGYSQLIPINENDKKLNLTEFNFLLGYRINDVSGNKIPMEEYFHPLFIVRKTKIVNGKFINERRRIPVVPCNEVRLNKEIDMNSLDLDSYLCPDFSGEDIFIEGNFDSTNITSIEFFISTCDENNSNCKKTEKIKELMKGNDKWLTTISTEVSYNINNLDQPFKTKLHRNEFLFSPNKFTYHQNHFSRYSSDTESGLFISTSKNEESIGVSKLFITENTFLDFFTDEEVEKAKEFYEFIFFQDVILVDEHIFYYKRWYQTIADVIALMIGVINGLTMFLSTIYSFYSKYHLGTYIFNKHLYLEDQPENVKSEIRNFFKFKNNKKKKTHWFDINKCDNINNIKTNQNLDNNNNADIIIELNNENQIEPEQIKKENKLTNKEILKIKSQLKKKIDKFAFTNKQSKFNFFIYLKNKICPTQTHTTYDILDLIIDKFKRRMDIFLYLKHFNATKFFFKILFSDSNKNLMGLILNKAFRIDMEKKNKSRIMNTQETINENISDYLIGFNENQLDKIDEEIIKNFLE